jgi:elongation factor P--(R)-beta-lysine ligase
MDHQNWQPTTDKNMLEARAALLGQIRRFFHDRQVLEVETPILSAAAGTDPALDPLHTTVQGAGSKEQSYYLQTSPEFAMKRLLASGSGPIYQLAKSFRNGEAGKKHNPEFTMLEWYRPEYSLTQLMDEVEELVSLVLGLAKAERLTYRELFLRHLGIDPLTSSAEALKKVARVKLDVSFDSDDADQWLDLLFSHCIEPQLHAPVFITHYPPSQSALAKLVEDEQGQLVALRFELVAQGMELANGFDELTDPTEQRQRFEKDLAQRHSAGLPQYPMDENFIAALTHGLPNCSGVAMGVDRLLMIKTNSNNIREVIPFPVDIS